MAVSKCKGTLLKIDIASTLTTVAQLTDLSPPKEESTGFEVVTLDQTDNDVHREPDGYNNTGDGSATVFLDPANTAQAALRTHLKAATKPTLQIEYPDGSTQDFDAATVGLQNVVAARDGLKQNIDWSVDGGITFTA